MEDVGELGRPLAAPTPVDGLVGGRQDDSEECAGPEPMSWSPTFTRKSEARKRAAEPKPPASSCVARKLAPSPVLVTPNRQPKVLMSTNARRAAAALIATWSQPGGSPMMAKDLSR